MTRVMCPYWMRRPHDPQTCRQRRSVGATRLLSVSKARREDFALTLVNSAAERFLYRLSRLARRDQFVLDAMLLAVRLGEPYRPTRDLDLLGIGARDEAAIVTAVREISSAAVEDDGLMFDVATLDVQPTREEDRCGGIRVSIEARLAKARIHVQIDVGFGDVITLPATDLNFQHCCPTCHRQMYSPTRPNQSSRRRLKRSSTEASRTAG